MFTALIDGRYNLICSNKSKPTCGQEGWILNENEHWRPTLQHFPESVGTVQILSSSQSLESEFDCHRSALSSFPRANLSVILPPNANSSHPPCCEWLMALAPTRGRLLVLYAICVIDRVRLCHVKSARSCWLPYGLRPQVPLRYCPHSQCGCRVIYCIHQATHTIIIQLDADAMLRGRV